MVLKPGDLGIDYSYSRPNLQEAARSGAKFVIRYSAGAASSPYNPSHDLNRGKLIGPVEFHTIINAGLDVIANDEWYESRMTEGSTAGWQDAHAACALWRQCGLARGAAIYVSWDQDPARSKWPAAKAYLISYEEEATRQGYKVGVYAGTPFLKYARSGAFGRFLIRFLWRPNAGSWSGDGLPYQPDTSTAAKRAALVQLALKKTPANIWQTGNYWFGKSADENLVLRVPVGSHLDAVEANKPTPPPAPEPVPTPDPVDGKEIQLTPDEKAYFDAKFAALDKDLRALFSDSKGKPHMLMTWLSKLKGSKVDVAQ